MSNLAEQLPIAQEGPSIESPALSRVEQKERAIRIIANEYTASMPTVWNKISEMLAKDPRHAADTVNSMTY